MKPSSTVLPAVVALLTLAACGGSGTRTVVVTRPAVAGAGTTGTAPATPKPTRTTATSVTYSAAVVVVAGAYANAIVHLTNFRSPTGNIGCVMLDGTARCDIVQRSWKPPPRPANCSREVDFGQGLEVGGSGKGTFVCAGDTALNPDAKALPYSTASVEGNLTCISAFAGVTCANLPGHGFFISRQSYRVF